MNCRTLLAARVDLAARVTKIEPTSLSAFMLVNALSTASTRITLAQCSQPKPQTSMFRFLI
jgi:hypothetical protein